MPLFVCDSCHAIENTALGHYWSRGHDFGNGPTDSRALCSECMPKTTFKGGQWHNKFEKIIATTEIIKEMGETNFVYTGDILGVCAKNPCCDYRAEKKEKQVFERKKLRVITCKKCTNSFKARKTSVCRVCGEAVEYE